MEKMDTQTLRLILAVIGIIIIALVYIWGRHKSKILDFIYQRGEYDELETPHPKRAESPKSNPPQKLNKIQPDKGIDPPISFDEFEDNEFFTTHEAPKPITEPTEPAPRQSARTAPLGAPFLIQISVVAEEEGYFVGQELREALDDLRLIYGDMGIYHRYDRDYRTPLFSVASLVEPGSFPIKDMENFQCPGIALFFQPPQVDNPLGVFDDLIATCHALAYRLNGIEWDENRKPLTVEKIAQMRSRLKEAN
jgi:cell division protein ZipA